jgi:hypothetical protein
MQLRYFFELGTFYVIACLFQNMIGTFVTSFRSIKLEIEKLTLMKATGKLQYEIYAQRD